MNTISKTGGAALAILAASAMFVGIADAATANNLNCKGCVGTRDLGKKAVTGRKIRDKAIRTKHLKDGSVSVDKLSTAAQPTAASNSAAQHPFNIQPDTYTVILADDIALPTDGQIVAFANWRWSFQTGEGCWCSITLDTEEFALERGTRAAAAGNNTTNIPASVSTVFEDVPAGDHTVRVICKTDGDDEVYMSERSLTSLFVPGQI